MLKQQKPFGNNKSVTKKSLMNDLRFKYYSTVILFEKVLHYTFVTYEKVGKCSIVGFHSSPGRIRDDLFYFGCV